MNIVVNTRLLLSGRLEGIGRFTYETFKIICHKHPEHRFIFLFDRPYSNEFVFADHVIPVVIPPQARHPVLFYLWFEFSVRWQLKKQKADVFVSPDGYLPLSSKIKSLSVIHDLNFEHYPEDVPLRDRLYYKYFFPRFSAKATRIATVSEFSKQDIVRLYHKKADDIDVVYNGANNQFVPLPEESKQNMRDALTDGKPYFIFIGSLHPRKNIGRLFSAFDLFCEKNASDVKLLIVGQKKNWTAEIRASYESMKHKDRVVFAGRMKDEDLYSALASALALTYVPYFEGFGIPIMEAFYCDTAVITSNCTSMPEVSGDAACLADPFSIESIAGCMEKIYCDEAYRSALIQKGRERARMFSWEKSADLLWESIEKTLLS